MKFISIIFTLILISCANVTPQPAADVPVVVSARFTLTEAGREPFLQLANAMLIPTRREPGCISHAFYQDPNNANDFIYFEQWASREALAAHLRQPYTKALLERFSDSIDGIANIRVYDVKSMTYNLDDFMP